MDNNNQKIYYSIDEVRQVVFANGISKSPLLNMAHSGELPTTRIMRRYFVPCWWVTKQIATATTAPNEATE